VKASVSDAERQALGDSGAPTPGPGPTAIKQPDTVPGGDPGLPPGATATGVVGGVNLGVNPVGRTDPAPVDPLSKETAEANQAKGWEHGGHPAGSEHTATREEAEREGGRVNRPEEHSAGITDPAHPGAETNRAWAGKPSDVTPVSQVETNVNEAKDPARTEPNVLGDPNQVKEGEKPREAFLETKKSHNANMDPEALAKKEAERLELERAAHGGNELQRQEHDARVAREGGTDSRGVTHPVPPARFDDEDGESHAHQKKPFAVGNCRNENRSFGPGEELLGFSAEELKTLEQGGVLEWR
jgi:hypothetical protein